MKSTRDMLPIRMRANHDDDIKQNQELETRDNKTAWRNVKNANVNTRRPIRAASTNDLEYFALHTQNIK